MVSKPGSFCPSRYDGVLGFQACPSGPHLIVAPVNLASEGNDAGQPPGEVERLRIDGRRSLSRLRRQSGLGVLEQQPIEAGKLVYTISAVDRSSAG